MKKLAILGLANAGKSTLFNALLTQEKAEVSNYPFCTIKPNIGIVKVPDERLERLQKALGFTKKIPAPLEIIDLAGLIKGAHKGEGLGNQFLSEARTASAFILVLRVFPEPEVVHHSGQIDPAQDFEILTLEIFLKDLEQIKGILNKVGEKTDKLSLQQKIILEKIEDFLEKSQFPKISAEEEEKIAHFNLLSLKPFLVVLNISEEQLPQAEKLANEFFEKTKIKPITIAAKLEKDLISLSSAEQKEYLKIAHIEKSALEKIIIESFKFLKLISFYTLAEDYLQAWPIERGTPAKKAAGIVHSDFEEKFKRAERIIWKKLAEIGSWQKAKNQGKIETISADYKVQDGDILRFII